MSKCGKGCMPECEYFVTCGCTSPFNCPYKIEKNYQNSTFTTGNSNFLSGIKKWFMQLVEEGKIPQTPMNYDTASYKAYVAHLEAENAALRNEADTNAANAIQAKLRADELEATLFWVVRNLIVFPVGMRMDKSAKEITKMAFDRIEELKKQIDYEGTKKIMEDNRNERNIK